ncbi:MAG: tyrosine-type recombinase/integrase [Candidatus Fimimorpha sp.]
MGMSKKSKRLDFLRHSHVSMLIDMGIGIKEITDRLGHESPQTTWGTYAHLYPGKDRELADELDKIRVQKMQPKIQILTLNITLTSRAKK